jgi:lipopolysaccharide export system protein LptC
MMEASRRQVSAGSPQAAERDGRSRAFARAERHSRRVRLLKIGLPVLAVVLAIVFAGIAYIRLPEGASIDVASSSISDGKLVMANPKLGGFTRDNEPYSMSALRAIQDMAGGNVVKLEKITAELPFNQGNSALVDAGTGYLDRQSNRLELADGLTIQTRDGIKAVLNSAFIDLASSTMETKEPVEVALNGALLSADSMRAEAKGRVMIFENRVRLHIDPGKLDTAFNAVGGAVAAK